MPFLEGEKANQRKDEKGTAEVIKDIACKPCRTLLLNRSEWQLPRAMSKSTEEIPSLLFGKKDGHVQGDDWIKAANKERPVKKPHLGPS